MFPKMSSEHGGRTTEGLSFAAMAVAAVVGVRGVAVLMDGDVRHSVLPLIAGTALFGLLKVSRWLEDRRRTILALEEA